MRRRWNLWFPSAGVFAEVLAGRATGTQITFPHDDIENIRQMACIYISLILNLMTLNGLITVTKISF